MSATRTARIARPQAAIDTVATPRPERREPPPDPAWDAALVELLSALEHARTELPARAGGNGAALLAGAEGMVAAAEKLAAATEFPAALGDEQATAVAKAGEFFLSAGEARSAVRASGVFRMVWSRLAGPVPGAAPAARGALVGAADALAAYFALFTRRFPSSAAGRWWVTAASSFLADLRQQARDLAD